MTSMWTDRRVLVTGATGLLGGHLCRALHAAGADVIGLVRDWVPDSLFLSDKKNRYKIARGDVRDQEGMERIMVEYEVKTVFHLAAQALVPCAQLNQISTLDTNIRGTWSTLEASVRSRCVREIIVASSDKAYGNLPDDATRYVESDPLRGIHPYDVSKSCADMIAQSYANSIGPSGPWVSIARCGNLFGEGDLNWNRLIPGTIRSILKGERPIIRSNGSPTRDYFYVGDAAQAYMLLAAKLTPALSGEAFNFSYETGFPVVDIVAKISEYMKSDLEPKFTMTAVGEIPEQLLSTRKARTVLGWNPSFHSIDSGLALTIEWYRKHFSK